MRSALRIPVIIKKMNWNLWVDEMFGGSTPAEIAKYKKAIKKYVESDELKKAWTHSPDLRLGQLFTISGLIPDYYKPWGNEEVDFMVEHNLCKYEEIHFWGTYSKSGTDPLKQVVLKKLKDDHILAILTDYAQGKQRLLDGYIRYFLRRTL